MTQITLTQKLWIGFKRLWKMKAEDKYEERTGSARGNFSSLILMMMNRIIISIVVTIVAIYVAAYVTSADRAAQIIGGWFAQVCQSRGICDPGALTSGLAVAIIILTNLFILVGYAVLPQSQPVDADDLNDDLDFITDQLRDQLNHLSLIESELNDMRVALDALLEGIAPEEEIEDNYATEP